MTMRRPFVAAAWFAAAVVVTLIVWLTWNTRPSTRFAPGFNRAEFRALRPGTTLPTVVQHVGNPVAFLVCRAGDDPEVKWKHFMFTDVPQLLRESDGSARVQLIYSWRAASKRPWEVHVVHVRDGAVEGTGVYPAGSG
jgi:hypothetical protein